VRQTRPNIRLVEVARAVERGTARLLGFSILFRLGTVRLMFVTPVELGTLNHLARSALHRPC
jgi:hypothetical protein